jgi:hypothetical protein
MGCDHKTVNAWLERERDGRPVEQRPRATDAHLPLIRAKLAATQGKIKSKYYEFAEWSIQVGTGTGQRLTTDDLVPYASLSALGS